MTAILATRAGADDPPWSSSPQAVVTLDQPGGYGHDDGRSAATSHGCAS